MRFARWNVLDEEEREGCQLLELPYDDRQGSEKAAAFAQEASAMFVGAGQVLARKAGRDEVPAMTSVVVDDALE